MNRILIAEDSDRIAAFVGKGLRANGFITTVVVDATPHWRTRAPASST